MSSLSECISKASTTEIAEPKFTNVDFDEGFWIKVIASSGGYFWVKNNRGDLITIAPVTASKGWSLYLEKKAEKWCAWFYRPKNAGYHPAIEYKPPEWKPGDVGSWDRLEQLDFTIEVTE